MTKLFYKGKGNHSVNDLETLCEDFKEQVYQLNLKLQSARSFLEKTSGESDDPTYKKCPDYWHDIGWEKDLTKTLLETSSDYKFR